MSTLRGEAHREREEAGGAQGGVPIAGEDRFVVAVLWAQARGVIGVLPVRPGPRPVRLGWWRDRTADGPPALAGVANLPQRGGVLTW